MNKIPVHNPSMMPMYVGSTMILPGETRHFDEQDVPHHLRPQKEEQAAAPVIDDPFAELLKGTVKDVVVALAGMTTADIEQLGELEQQGQQRKGILSAIAELLMNRAANADLLTKAAAFTDEELAAELEAVGADTGANPDYIAALEAEAAKRNPGAAE